MLMNYKIQFANSCFLSSVPVSPLALEKKTKRKSTSRSSSASSLNSLQNKVRVRIGILLYLDYKIFYSMQLRKCIAQYIRRDSLTWIQLYGNIFFRAFLFFCKLYGSSKYLQNLMSKYDSVLLGLLVAYSCKFIIVVALIYAVMAQLLQSASSTPQFSCKQLTNVLSFTPVAL